MIITLHVSDEQIYWAFRNVERQYFLGATSSGEVICTAKMPQSRAELWHVHLVPARGATMFALRSIGRKRYARSSYAAVETNDVQSQIQLDLASPWGKCAHNQCGTMALMWDALTNLGPESLFQIKYFGDGGRYSLLTYDGKYLTADGACIEWSANKNGATALPPVDTLFTIEYHGGSIAFRGHQGRYLAGTGRGAILRTRAANVSRDELFEIEQAPIQVALRATTNNKWVSIKQSEWNARNKYANT